MNIVIWIYKLGNGGAERVIADLAASFSKTEKVTLLLHTDDGIYQSDLNQNIHIQNLGKNLPPFFKPKTFFCLFGLLKFIKSEQPDIIFTTGTQHSVILLFLSRLFRFSSKIIIRETNTISVQSQKSKNLIDRFGLWAARLFYPAADKIIAPSHGVAEDLKKHIPNISNKIKVILNPINFQNIRQKSQHPLPAHLEKNTPYILAVGRLVPQKGHQDLIQAWAPIYKEQGVELIILGEGPERKKLIRLSSDLGVLDGLHLPGFDENPFNYMKNCKVFILSSYYEGLPNTLLQALACGCPVIATNCPSGPNEILQQGELGELVPVGDIKGMQNAIQHQLHSPANDAARNRKVIQALYDKDKISEQYLAIFTSVL